MNDTARRQGPAGAAARPPLAGRALCGSPVPGGPPGTGPAALPPPAGGLRRRAARPPGVAGWCSAYRPRRPGPPPWRRGGPRPADPSRSVAGAGCPPRCPLRPPSPGTGPRRRAIGPPPAPARPRPRPPTGPAGPCRRRIISGSPIRSCATPAPAAGTTRCSRTWRGASPASRCCRAAVFGPSATTGGRGRPAGRGERCGPAGIRTAIRPGGTARAVAARRNGSWLG